MRFRVWLTQHLGAPATAEPAAWAEDWLQGRADLLIAGMGGQVPAVVQLGVLAHADLHRLADLGRNSRLGSVRRAWGTEMARLAGLAATPGRLAALQRNLLVPLELEALAGRAPFSTRRGAISHLQNQRRRRPSRKCAAARRPSRTWYRAPAPDPSARPARLSAPAWECAVRTPAWSRHRPHQGLQPFHTASPPARDPPRQSSRSPSHQPKGQGGLVIFDHPRNDRLCAAATVESPHSRAAQSGGSASVLPDVSRYSP
jgi:hypothetical protein